MTAILEDAYIEIAEEIAEKWGLSLPTGNEKIRVAANLLAFEAIKSVTEIIYPAALSSMSFSGTGITLAIIKKKLDEINKKIDTLLDVYLKSAKNFMTSSIIALTHQNYEDAYDGFKKVHMDRQCCPGKNPLG